MPSGYAAAVLWAMAVILWWSGWKRELADALPQAAMTSFLVGWPLLSRLTLPVPLPGIEATAGGTFLWTAAFALTAAILMGAARSGTAFAAGVLIGSVTLFTDKLSEAMPSMLPASPLWVSSSLIAVITALLTRSAAEQIVALTFGLALTESLSALWELHAFGRAAAGTLAWSDRWWLAFSEIRLLTVAAGWLPSLAKRTQWRKGGERS